jgi:signal transduction histidine kinase
VLLSSAIALSLPWLAERRIGRLRNDINEVARPARLDLADMQLLLALQGAQDRGHRLSGDSSMLERLEASRERRLAAERNLSARVALLDPIREAGLVERVATLAALAAQIDSTIASRRPRTPPSTVLEDQARRFAMLQSIADTLAVSIDSVAQTRRDAIGRTERVVNILTGALLLLAIGAAILVARLGGRYREIALRLERVTQSRIRLIRGFTHDVKNPLGVADGYLALIQEGALGTADEKGQATIVKVRRAIANALELIARQLDLARAEAGQLEIHPRDTDVAELVRDLSEAFRAQASKGQLDLSLEVAAGLPHVRTDATRVRQIVANLISNAVKYTPPGGRIVLHAYDGRAVGRRKTDSVTIAVADTGPGIPRDKLPMLFSEFTRFDPKAAEGAGIGLAIAQRLAQALGGRITVDTEEGRGSTFRLELPQGFNSVPQ